VTAPTAPGLTAPPRSAAERWRLVPRRWQVVIVAVALIAGVELASSLVAGLGSSGGGANGPSSSYDNGGSGTGAFAQLLRQRGFVVLRSSSPLGVGTVDRGSTVFVLDPTPWTSDTTAAIGLLAADGDRVVVAGTPPSTAALRAVLGTQSVPAWRDRPAGTTHPVADVPAVAGVRTVVSPGAGVFGPTGAGTLTTVLAGSGGVLALESRDGRGTIVMASASPLQNQALAQQDNAAFGLGLAGTPGSHVVFDEYDHGFGHAGRGLAGLPTSWRWGLGIALSAVGVWILSASRRFGPPERQERTMMPARIEYVEAMATLLGARPADQLAQATAPVVTEVGMRLRRQLGLSEDAPVDDLLRVMGEAEPGSVASRVAPAAVLPSHDAADALAAGAALSVLYREETVTS
jgi:Domain of unknown function (DUF4350)